MSTGQFITDEEIKHGNRENIMKAKEIVADYTEWKRFKGHLIFFKNSNYKS